MSSPESHVPPSDCSIPVRCADSGVPHLQHHASLPLPFLLLRPSFSTTNRLPALLLLLHGTGADEEYLLPVGRAAQASAAAVGRALVVASLRAPLPHPERGYRWFRGITAAPEAGALDEDLPSAVDAVLEFACSAPSVFSTNPSSTLLLGFSQGAAVGWAVSTTLWGAHRNDALAGCALFAGRLFDEHIMRGHPLAARVAPKSELVKRRIAAFHGTADTRCPFDFTAATLTAAISLGLWDESGALDGRRASFSRHDGGHELPSPELDQAFQTMWAWLDDDERHGR